MFLNQLLPFVRLPDKLDKKGKIMRTETIQKTYYKFNELDDNAKEKARDWMRQADDFSYHAESVIEDAKRVGALIGIDIKKIYYSGFSSQGDGACFEGVYQYKKGSVQAIKKECPLDSDLHSIVKGLQELQAKNKYQLYAVVKQNGFNMHSGCTDFDIPDAKNNEVEQDLKELLRDYMNWIYKRLSDAYDWSMSNEVIDESIECSEYEFDENGRIA